MRRRILAKRNFKIDLYNIHVSVVIVRDGGVATKKSIEICKKHGMDHSTLTGEIHGCCMEIDLSNYALVYSAKDINHNTVTHETYHLTNYIEQGYDITQPVNNEPVANLNGYINQKVYDIFAEVGIKIA